MFLQFPKKGFLMCHHLSSHCETRWLMMPSSAAAYQSPRRHPPAPQIHGRLCLVGWPKRQAASHCCIRAVTRACGSDILHVVLGIQSGQDDLHTETLDIAALQAQLSEIPLWALDGRRWKVVLQANACSFLRHSLVGHTQRLPSPDVT